MPSSWDALRLEQLTARAQLGPYAVLGTIAAGGAGEVLLARDLRDGGPVAIKRLLPKRAGDEEFLAMFQHEAALGLALEHPNLCRVLEHGEHDGHPYLVMEWVDGISLRSLVGFREDGRVPPPVAARIIAEAARGLHHAHTATDAVGRPLGIVHRDVSPHNVMVGYRGEVKVLDFGIAKADGQLVRTRSGVVKGKYPYMAPEQCLDHRVDPRTDVYALGMCLYRTVTGIHPFASRRSVVEVMRAVVYGSLPAPRTLVEDLHPGLDEIIRWACTKAPGARPPTAAALADALEQLLERDFDGYPVRDLVPLLDDLVPVADRNPLRDARTTHPTESGVSGPVSLGHVTGTTHTLETALNGDTTIPSGPPTFFDDSPVRPLSSVPPPRFDLEAWQLAPAEPTIRPAFFLLLVLVTLLSAFVTFAVRAALS